MMAKQGLFGELLHGSGGYVHDLRDPYMFHGAYYPEGWRRQWHTRMNATHYPMHGLGPVSFHDGRQPWGPVRPSGRDRLARRGVWRCTGKENLPPDHPSWGETYISGDRHEVFIQTANGRFIRSDHEVVTPHPYTRRTTLVGTRGAWDENLGIYLESLGHDGHTWREFRRRLRGGTTTGCGRTSETRRRSTAATAAVTSSPSSRLVQLMRLGLRPDIDVYDSAAWCSVIPLSETSLMAGSLAVKVPDFTRGHWQQERPGLSRGRPSRASRRGQPPAAAPRRRVEGVIDAGALARRCRCRPGSRWSWVD